MRLEEERRKEKEVKDRMESIKKMECKVNDAYENLKILNLRFKKVSDVKVELLKEAEGIIKGKVADKDRKECEWILQRSRVYILGKGTEEKNLGNERICTLYSTSASEVWITGGKGKAGRHVKEHGGDIGLSLAEGDDGVCG
jgi:hypothetical protein